MWSKKKKYINYFQISHASKVADFPCFFGRLLKNLKTLIKVKVIKKYLKPIVEI